ncbi:hypothetical protein KO561_18835 [Radiobacillus kanasensis]|uniref:hypothetical protein n=1 Tax=Radiobacillus kanasensis TaxID=2844358 RepID=UPI001E41653F|nr:hypothetical protein [Radiobacillus kanasensis]UFT99206.1 hypothetical protein KO561_18835 [Radiobacillus kanasensis]
MSQEEKVLSYLEDKYNKEFEIEYSKEGSELFPKMYGGDNYVVHPKDNNEIVFSVEALPDESGFADGYTTANWAYELENFNKEAIDRYLPELSEFKIMLRASPGIITENVDSKEIDALIKESPEEFTVILKTVVRTSNIPNVQEYSDAIYKLFNLVKGLKAKDYIVTVGFVDSESNISDYIRTANVNNISWENLDAKVYGFVTLDNRLAPENPGNGVNPNLLINSKNDVVNHYESLEE